LLAENAAVSVDSCLPETQRYAVRRGVSYLNDIRGFPDPSTYPLLARAGCRLVVMHSVQRAGRATREQVDAATLLDEIDAFFAGRIDALCTAGVRRDRLILDPGMGFFLGSDAEASLRVLRGVRDLKRRFALPVLVSVSRKSFLGALTGAEVSQRGAATLAAELYAAAQGVDYIRTHDVAALRDALTVLRALDGGGEMC
jgi:dihydropteroate synthase type 2